MDRFTLFSEDSLLKIVDELSVNKSSGIQDLPTNVILDAIRI